MASISATLKEINEQKRLLTEQQRKLREELNASKEERKAARKTRAQIRRGLFSSRADLRKHTSAVFSTLSNGSEGINELADSIEAASTAIVDSLREFSALEDEI
jgi:uncharacterized protein (DUF3084 family)